jgi:hypothetical protein
MDPWHDSSAQDTRLDLESYCWGRLKKSEKIITFLCTFERFYGIMISQRIANIL